MVGGNPSWSEEEPKTENDKDQGVEEDRLPTVAPEDFSAFAEMGRKASEVKKNNNK